MLNCASMVIVASATACVFRNMYVYIVPLYDTAPIKYLHTNYTICT